MTKTVMARISEEAREHLNTLAEEEGVSAAFFMTCLVEVAWSRHVQASCPHVWEDASTGSGDCVEEHSVCQKCGLLQ